MSATPLDASAAALPVTDPNQLYRASHYGKVLRRLMPDEAFQPQPGRLWFGLMHMAIVWSMGALCMFTSMHWGFKVLAAMVAGHSWAILGFFAHEIWHGSVIKPGKLEHFLGHAFSFINLSSGRVWKIWHNETHHKHTQVGRVDPDAFPYLDYVRTEPKIRMAQPIIPGFGGPLSYLALTYTWFLKCRWAGWELLFGRTHGNAKGVKHMLVIESIGSFMPWVVLFYFFRWEGAVYLFLIPSALTSVFNMLYIHSNHHLSPRTPVNDPLINSLTVTSPRFIQWFHGDFGFHVEHHIFPSMSPRYARQLHELLKANYPDRYQVMPWWKAIKLLFQTGTAYTDDGERLVNTRTGETQWTLRHGRDDFAPGDRVDVSVLAKDAVGKRRARDGKVVMGHQDAAGASDTPDVPSPPVPAPVATAPEMESRV